MAGIGDLFMRVIADLKGFSTSVEKEAGKAGDKGGKALTKGMARHTSSLKKGVLQGLGLGAGLGVIGLAAGAIGGIADAIGNATKAAIADEQSQTKLRAALTANIPAWSGNTDAIEKTLKSRMKLGFSDDEQRESLALLVVATNSETKALDLERAAMDLARLKGISLAEASQALIKVEGGQFKALKALGIQLEKGATQTEALAAVQAAANGQAEAYANTVGGRLLANQVKFDEAMENFGAKTLPLVTGALEAVTFALDRSTVPLETLIKNAGHGGGAANALAELQKAADEMGITLEEAWAIASDAGVTGADAIVAAGRASSDALEDARQDSRSALLGPNGMTAGFEDLADEAEESTDLVIVSFEDMVNKLADAAQSLIDQVYDPAIQAAELAATKHEMAELRKVIASKKSTAEEKRDAADRLLSLSKSADETRLALLKSGNLTAEDTKTWLDKLQKKYRNSTGDAKVKIGLLIAKIKELAAIEAGGISISVSGPSITGGGSGSNARAGGGPVKARQPYIVGERRPELFVPSVNGRIIPDLKSPAAKSMGGYTDNSTVNLTALPVKADLMTAVHELQRISDGKRLRRWG